MLNEIKEIYNNLADQTSKNIFECRLMYSISKDASWLAQLLENSDLYETIHRKLQKDCHKKIIFGMGLFGKVLVETFNKEFHFEGFCDNYRYESYQGVPFIELPELVAEYKEETIYISVRNNFDVIKKQLIEAGIQEKHIVCIGEYVLQSETENQYFDLPELRNDTDKKEVFIDGGSFDGKTTERFFEWAAGRNRAAYIFEPEDANLNKCRKTLANYPEAEKYFIKKGLWDKCEKLNFSCDGDGFGARISEEGTSAIEVDSLDHMVDEQVTFLKLDIEGAELKALMGAENIIRRDKPRLAVCIYHKDEDIIEIPTAILRMRDDYKFYLRQYSIGFAETVLYAL